MRGKLYLFVPKNGDFKRLLNHTHLHVYFRLKRIQFNKYLTRITIKLNIYRDIVYTKNKTLVIDHDAKRLEIRSKLI